VLSGTTVLAATAGVAAFTDLSIDVAGTGYTLTASAAGPAGSTSAPFNVSAAPASNLSYTVEPVTTTAGASIAPAVKVTAKDGAGNVQAGFTGDVTLTITAGTGILGAVLSGTSTVAAVWAPPSPAGIDKAGIGYTLSATAAGLAGAASAGSTSPPAWPRSSFTLQPASITGTD
jgi:hypothetical protein